MVNKYDKAKYNRDFPDEGYFNWKTAQLTMPENIYYNGHKQNGVLLHDGNFMINGVLFLKGQFKIIDEDPLNYRKPCKKHKWKMIDSDKIQCDVCDTIEHVEPYVEGSGG